MDNFVELELDDYENENNNEFDSFNSAVVWGMDWTAETIANQLEKGNIDINPKFQRRDAWTQEEKSRLIESLMLGLPVPTIILAEMKGRKSGHRILVTDITGSGEMFGEVYLFMKQENYDVHAQAVEDSVIFEMSGEILTGKRILLLQNLLGIFAEKAYSLNGKVRVLGGNSLREKIVRFMYENLKRRGMDYMEPGAVVKIGREDMAEYLNVARPSLSRELGRMQREGILRIQGRALSVKDSSSFEDYL